MLNFRINWKLFWLDLNNYIISTMIIFFYRSRFCAPQCLLRIIIILEYHEGGIARHFRWDKTLALIQENFFWNYLKQDVERFIKRFHIYKLAKTHGQSTWLYIPLLIPLAPCVDVGFNFILGLLVIQRRHDFIMVIVDKFSKMVHYMPCSKTSDASHVADLYFREVVHIHGFLEWSLRIEM